MEGDDDRVEALAEKLHKEGKIDLLEQELLRLNPAQLSGREKESWYHIYGVEAFRKRQREVAFQRFQEGVKQCPDSGVLAFSLGQEYERKRMIPEMFSCFDRAIFPHVPARFAIAEARYAYLWNRPEKGTSYVEPIMGAYFAFHVLDDTFLYIRKLPFFGETWSYLAAFSELSGDFQGLKDLTDRAVKECSDFDFDYLKLQLQAYESGDFSPLRAYLEKDLGGYRTGYSGTRLGVLESQACDDPDEAHQKLARVKLGENDFRWLSDILLLARCELAHRRNDSDGEKKLQHEFMKKQPMLFEPDHMVNFNLLRYQESLKTVYQASGLGTDGADAK